MNQPDPVALASKAAGAAAPSSNGSKGKSPNNWNTSRNRCRVSSRVRRKRRCNAFRTR